MNITIDLHLKKSISKQLEDGVRRSIVEGELQPGEQMPTVRQLAAQTHVNFNTVARVYRLLDLDGWISTQQGRGTYVIDRENQPIIPSPALNAQIAKRIADQIILEAKRLGISMQQMQHEIDQQLFQAKEPINHPAKITKKTNKYARTTEKSFLLAGSSKKTHRKPRAI